MKLSGAIESSKYSYLQYVPEQYLPKKILITKHTPIDKIKGMLENHRMEYPLIAKPDTGLRGLEIDVITQQNELLDYLKRVSRTDILIQEFIEFPIEFGILYSKTPLNNQTKLSSVTLKKFLNVTGYGVSTFKSLLSKKSRAEKHFEFIKIKYPSIWESVVEKGKTIRVEPIGNHNRGTEFVNANMLITPELVAVVDEIVRHIPGFYYGRIDIKAQSIQKLMKGKGIRILEINGVNSEPTHIYDSNTPITSAYKDVFTHMNTIYKISEQNKIQGEKRDSLKTLLKETHKHFSY